jgi:lanthionine synthetase-like protein
LYLYVVLYTRDRHEPLDEGRFTEANARAAITRIVERTERERSGTLWPRDREDRIGDEGASASLYWGAAGIAWALGELGMQGLEREQVEALAVRLCSDKSDPDFAVDGVWFGEAGALAVAEHSWPDEARRDRLFELAAASLASPALEPMLGHPGFMLIAAELHARTTEQQRWATLWVDGAKRLLDQWRWDEQVGAWLWTQQLDRVETRYLGAAHGLAGNLHVLRRGGALLPAAEAADVERRGIETLSRLAVIDDRHANWPPDARDRLEMNGRIRVQWCHGAAGVLTAMWDAAPEDEQWSDLLLRAGALVWDAGPLRDAPGICHGTAGSAYALLALWRRTRDERWLERARALALHAASQTDACAKRLGHGRHSLYTGDEGVALCLAACLSGEARLPVADGLI